MTKPISLASLLAAAFLALVLAAVPSLAKEDYKATHVAIRPHALNRRGSIGPGRVCPNGEYAIGFKMKVGHATNGIC